MTNHILPWHEMPESSKRRVSLISQHNVYWITDIYCNYGIYIESSIYFESIKLPINLNGIEIIKRNSSSGHGELILLLNDKKDADIFYRICDDLIAKINIHHENNEMITAIEVRLQRWQEILRKSYQSGMSVELQMGLFTELSFLNSFALNHFSPKQTVLSWVGPEFDKQDFLFDTLIVEIKSYRTSKGSLVDISSIKQLHSDKQPLFLVAYGITPSDNGVSVHDLVKEISEYISKVSKNTLDLFNTKLLDYGYVPELESEPYISFIVDKLRCYAVKNEFPKVPLNLPQEIVKLRYTLDLSLCDSFEVDIDNIF